MNNILLKLGYIEIKVLYLHILKTETIMKNTLKILISKYEVLEIKSDLGLTTETEETLKDEIYHKIDSILFNS